MLNFRSVVGPLSCVLIVLSATRIAQAHEDDSPSFSIVVLGRSGSGVSSTVQELIGPLTQCPSLTGHPRLHPKILEYTLSNIASSNGRDKYSFKLIEVPELVENSTSKDEAEIFAFLKAYLQNDNKPKIFLVLSSFDDEDYENENSKFFHLLQRVQFFQQSFLSEESLLSSTGTMFLLNHLMDGRSLWQTRPQAKVEGYRAIIDEFTYVPPPILVYVGESRREKLANLRKESGYHVLPNKELYPKNVWENIQSLSSAWNNSQVVQDTITTFMKEGRVSENIVCDTEAAFKDWEFINEDVQDFTYFLERDLNWTLAGSKINNEIDQIFSTFPPNLQKQGSLQKIALQHRLEELGIETRANLPTTQLERMKLLAKIPLGVGAIILKKHFGLKMPEYEYPLNVGFGYNLLKDEALASTPFKKEFLMPNSIGYEFPAFMECTRMPEERHESFAEIVDSYSDYVSERLHSLHLPGNFVAESEFRGNVRAGFNIKEEFNGHNSTTKTISVLKEIRKVKCILSKSIILQSRVITNEFQVAVNNITKFNFDPTSRESVNSWRTFFERFGTHIVSASYGGGYLQATIPANGSEEDLNNILQKIKRQFTPRINSEIQIGTKWESGLYSFHGGNLNSHEDDLGKLETSKLSTLLGSWASSLTNDFVMLNHDLELQPISFIVGLHNETKGEMVSMALTKLLRGELRYVERKEVIEPWKDEDGWWSLAKTDEEEMLPPMDQPEGSLLKNILNVSSSSCGGLLDGPSGWINFSSADALLGQDKPSSCVWTIRANNHELIKLTTQLSVSNYNSRPVLNVIEIIRDTKKESTTPQIITTRLEENDKGQIYVGPVVFVVLSRASESDLRFLLQFEGIVDTKSTTDLQTLFNYKTFEGSVGSLSGTDLESLSSSSIKLNDDTQSTSTFVAMVYPNKSTNVRLEAIPGDMSKWCHADSSFILVSHIGDNIPSLKDCCKSDRRVKNLLKFYSQPFIVIIRKRVDETMNFSLTWRGRSRRDHLNSGSGSWTNVTVQNNHCGGVVIGKEGQLNYKLGRNYDNNERCLWLLHSPTSSNITITLMQSGLAYTYCCDYFNVHTVHPGSGTMKFGMHIISKNYSGTFEGSLLAIHFVSDTSSPGKGFSLRFSGNGDNIHPEYNYKLQHTSELNGITKYPDWDWEDDGDVEGGKEILVLASKLVAGSSQYYSAKSWQRYMSKFVGTSLSKSRTNCTYDTLNFYNAQSFIGYEIASHYPLPEEQRSCPNTIKIPDIKDVVSPGTDIPGILAIYKRVQDPIDSTNL